jgi:hypothetical protein
MSATPTSTRGAIFRAFVEDLYSAAADAFRDDPSAERWTDLRVAMWAWQFTKHLDAAALDTYASHTMTALAANAKGDNDFSEATT